MLLNALGRRRYGSESGVVDRFDGMLRPPVVSVCLALPSTEQAERAAVQGQLVRDHLGASPVERQC